MSNNVKPSTPANLNHSTGLSSPVKMVKEKQTRTYDQDGFRKRAACICVRDSQEHEILLVTSSRAHDHWIVPGGGVEPNEGPSGAAIRETEEEAGVRGVIKRCLGDFEVRDENLERKHRTSVFVLEVTEELDEWEDSKSRLRRWFPVEEALRLLAIHKPVQCTYIKLLIQTSPSLRQKLPHLISLESSHLNNSLPIFASPTDPSIVSSLSCKSGSPSDSSTVPSRYLQVNHYPSDGNNKAANSNNNNSNNNVSNASFHAFIYTRDVYSTDSEIGSETAEDGPGLVDSSNHFAGGVEATRESENANNKKSDLLPLANS